MRPAEIFLRIGSALVAWMVLYAFFVWLSVLHRVGCTTNDDEFFFLLMFVAPLAMGSALALNATRSFNDIHKILRWLGFPLLLTSIVAIRNILVVFDRVNLKNSYICPDTAVATWHEYWAPVQIMGILFCIWIIGTLWRNESHPEN